MKSSINTLTIYRDYSKNRDNLENQIIDYIENCKELEKLQNFYFQIFPYSLNLLKLDYKKIDDDYLKTCYEFTRLIKEVTDLDYLKKIFKIFIKRYHYQELNKNINNYLVNLEIKSLFENILDEEKLANLEYQEVLISSSKIKIYNLNQDFEALVHVVLRENIHLEEKLDLKNEPSKWGLNNIGSALISLSKVSNNHLNIFSATLASFTLNQLVLGFSNISSGEVYSISKEDSYTPTLVSKTESYNPLEYIIGKGMELEIGMKSSKYNEIAVRRFLPNQQAKYPICIFIRKKDIPLLSENSYQVKWANYFNIPIVAIDTIHFEEKYKKEFYEYLGKVKSARDYDKLMMLETLIYKLKIYYEWSGQYKIPLDLLLEFVKIVKLISKYKTYENIKKLISLEYFDYDFLIILHKFLYNYSFSNALGYRKKDELVRLMTEIEQIREECLEVERVNKLKLLKKNKSCN